MNYNYYCQQSTVVKNIAYFSKHTTFLTQTRASINQQAQTINLKEIKKKDELN